VSLKKGVLKGIAWRSFVDFGQMFLQIVFTAILARILTPVDFGLVVMALLFIRLIKTVTQVGFGTAIIQSQDVTEGQISAIFLIHITINTFVSMICYAAAPLAASFFNQSELIPLVHVLAWVILINSFAFPQTILQKRLQFGHYSLLEMFSMIMGNLVGIAAALKGFGVWSLVIKLMVQSIIFSMGIWPLAKWWPTKPQFAGISKLLYFGLYMLGSKILAYFSQNLAAIITGKLIGAETLGYFNIAYNLAIVPAQKVQTILTTALTPAFSKIQNHVTNLRDTFFLSLFSLGIVFIPLMLGLSVVAPNLVLVIYGEQWQEAGLFLTFLAIVGLFKGIQHLLLSVIVATGNASTVLRITAIETALSLPLLFLGSYLLDVIGLILAYLIVSFIAFVLTVQAAQIKVEDNTLFIRATQRSFIAAGVMFAVTLGYATLVELHLLVILCTQIILGGILYGLLRFKLLTAKERILFNRLPLAHLITGNKIK